MIFLRKLFVQRIDVKLNLSFTKIVFNYKWFYWRYIIFSWPLFIYIYVSQSSLRSYFFYQLLSITQRFLALWPIRQVPSFHQKISLESLLLWFIFIFKWARFYWKFDMLRWYFDCSSLLYTRDRFLRYFAWIFLFNIWRDFKVLIGFLLHFLIFSCIHFGIFLDKRLIFIDHFGLIIFIFGIKLCIKRFRHFVGKSYSLDFIFHIPTW
jgi:hypothetical protein